MFNEKNREKTWEFDEVFGFDSKQEDIYTEVSALVISVLDGYNVCIFACECLSGESRNGFRLILLNCQCSENLITTIFFFAVAQSCFVIYRLDGQTGSGKTFTMSGPPENR